MGTNEVQIFHKKGVCEIELPALSFLNKIGNMYSLEYTDVPKMFMPNNVSHFCTNVLGNIVF
jgi:hypothetical protein